MIALAMTLSKDLVTSLVDDYRQYLLTDKHPDTVRGYVTDIRDYLGWCEARGADLGPVNDGGVVRLGEARAVMHDHHLVARNVDQLVVLRLQRADIEEAILGELVQRHQPFAVRLLGLAH